MVLGGAWSQGGAWSGGVCAWSQGGLNMVSGVHGSGGCMVLGGAWSGGVWSQGGCIIWVCVCVVQGVLGRDPPTATAAGGMHPTGMHSCLKDIYVRIFIQIIFKVNFTENETKL